MAYSANTTFLSPSARARFDAFFAAFGQGFNAYIETLSRRPQIEALEALTDEELSRKGLTRDEIPAYVFRDRLGF